MIYSGENYKIILGGQGLHTPPPALILFYQLVKKKKNDHVLQKKAVIFWSHNWTKALRRGMWPIFPEMWLASIPKVIRCWSKDLRVLWS